MVVKRQHPLRRGTAILLALAATVLVLVIITGLVTSAVALQYERELDRSTDHAHELVSAVDPLIQQWLSDIAGGIVLSPEAGTPEVGVYHGDFTVDANEFEVRITGWDQQGMLPITIARSNSPLRLTLPFAVQDAVSGIPVNTSEAIGLDQWLPKEPATQSFPVFPVPRQSSSEPARIYSTTGASPKGPSSPGALIAMTPASGANGQQAIGAFVATHPDRSTNARDQRIALNVNTAPLSLIEAAMREAGRGGVDVIRSARAEGIPVNLSDLPEQPTELAHDRPLPTLTGQSDAWAFRIDCRVNNIWQSWWRVYQRTETGESPTWKCVQSIAIPY